MCQTLQTQYSLRRDVVDVDVLVDVVVMEMRGRVVLGQVRVEGVVQLVVRVREARDHLIV